MQFGDDDAAEDRPTFPDDPSSQHAPLAERIRKLEILVREGGAGSDLAEPLDELIAEFRHHFDTEERAMERGEYPMIEDHRDSHSKFMRHLEMLRRELGDGSGGVTRPVIEQLRNWFEDHMHTADADALKFLGFVR